MDNLEKNKDINYWNPEWINESFYDENLEDIFNNEINQRYLLLLSFVDNQQKKSTIQNRISTIHTCIKDPNIK